MTIPAKGNKPLDDIDYAILRILQEDGSRDRQEISLKLKALGHELGPAACYNRYRSLKSRGYIKNVQAILDPNMFGLPQTAFMIVHIEQRDDKSVEKFLVDVRREHNVMAIYKMAGLCDFIIKLQVADVDSAMSISSHLAGTTIARIETFFASTDSWETSVIKVGNNT